MQLVDARRLTGPNFFGRNPLVIVEIGFEQGETLARVQGAYITELARMREALELPPLSSSTQWTHQRGAVIAYEGPIDIMLPLTEMSEWAALSAVEVLAGRAPLDLEPKRTEIASMLERDRSPRLLALQAEARRRGVPFMWDDDAVSVGHGMHSKTWPRSALPLIDEVEWSSLQAIPVALITGTNGKTTSSRLLAHIARKAGHHVGNTSSDAIMINGRVIDDGDWTGPFAARAVLRHPEVDFAVLETARGGILRRGLAVDSCDAALITNVTKDHTGGYGIDDLETMTQVKAVVGRAATGTVVLNARDPKLVAIAKTFEARRLVFFGDEHVAHAHAVFVRRGVIWTRDEGVEEALIDVAEVPLTFGGAATHNVDNVLGVIAMARALGLPKEAVLNGLRTFTTRDNPGRGEIMTTSDGVRVMLDFGHNPEGIRAILSLVQSIRAPHGAEPKGRLSIIAGSAGDRQNDEVEEMCRVIVEVARPSRVFLRELKDYLRGREPGEMQALFRTYLVRHGMADSAIVDVESEVEGLRVAFEDATADDFVVILVHLDRDGVRAFLEMQGVASLFD